MKELKISKGTDNPTAQAANELPKKYNEQPQKPPKMELPKAKPAPSDGPIPKPRGRPKKDPEHRQSERLSVAITPQELQDINDISDATGIGVSEIVRILILRYIEDTNMETMRRAAELRRQMKQSLRSAIFPYCNRHSLAPI